jgi:peptide/nickel transport system substrate-binding protein
MKSPQTQQLSAYRLNIIDRVFAFIESRKPFDRLLLKVSLLVFVLSLGVYLTQINQSYLALVPHRGGSLHEGIVGTPRFVNPLLAVTPADKDVAALVYAGLMKLGPEGTLINDMAESVTMSADGLTYSIALKNNLTFHDGTPVTSDDVIFTIARIEDPALKSPLLASWEGVTLERVSDRELNMVLEKPYAPFIENLTLGILPKHIWEDASPDAFPFSQYNSEPIGSGPYKIERVVRSTSGIPESYTLVPFEAYALGTPKIARIMLSFYQNEEVLISDWKRGEITSAGGLSHKSIAELGDISGSHTLRKVPLPRTFAVFFNQNEAPLFRDHTVREVLSLITDRAPIISEVLDDHGYPIAGPLPPTEDQSTTPESPNASTLDTAKNKLRDGGWKFDGSVNRWKKTIGGVDTELAFTLATANTETLERTAEILKSEWEEIGVSVTVQKYEQVDLTQTVIRPRKFDALLFGTVAGRERDFYPFWHSSQRNDPGLNIALYANLTTDTILTDARTTLSYEERMQKNQIFADELMKDTPAIFLYAPAYIYLLPNTVRDVAQKGIAEPYERFASSNNWYIETESVWKFFTQS